jgi:hypothetical protein
MMKMIPDAEGSTIPLMDGSISLISSSADMSTTFVEEMNDLGVAVFVQEASTKMIFQSAYSTESMVGVAEGMPERDNLLVYPNPSNGFIKFSRTIEKADVSVYNIYGQEVTRIADYSGNAIDLQDLPAGNYILRLDGPEMREIKTISIIK